MKKLSAIVAVFIMCVGFALSGCTRTVIATPTPSTAPVAQDAPTVQNDDPPLVGTPRRISVDRLLEHVVKQTTSHYLTTHMGFAHILYAEVRRAQRITNPTEIGQVSQIKTIMWRKIVWSRMEMSRERRFSEFFTLLQNEIDEEFERAERQDRIESRVVFVPVINVLQSIADATVPYCPTVCLHY